MQAKFVRNSGDCRNWLVIHVNQLGSLSERLEQINPMLRRITGHEFSQPVGVKMLEMIREAVVGSAEKLFREAQGLAPPLRSSLLQNLAQVDQSMVELGRAYTSVYQQTVQAEERGRRAVIEHASNSRNVVLPLARALDTQSRRIAGRLRARVVVDDILWAELAELAEQMRASSFMDEKFPDPLARSRPGTARAMFTYPLLLSIARCSERGIAQGQFVEVLARRWAHRVGFRIDPMGGAKPNPYGPTLELGGKFRVRLDTHNLLAAMAQCCEEWATGLAIGNAQQNKPGSALDLALITETCADLRNYWSAAWRPPQPSKVLDGSSHISMGLPDDGFSPAAYAQGMSRVSGAGAPSLAASSSYSYGRYERDELVQEIRTTQAAPSQPGAASIVENFIAKAQKVRLTQIDHQRMVLERNAPLPSAVRHGLVAMVVDRRSVPSAQLGLTLGRIRAVEHMLGEGVGQAGTRIEVETWQGALQQVVFNSLTTKSRQQAYLLAPAPDADMSGETATVFVPSGALMPGASVLLQRAHDDISVQVGALVERGPGFDRFAVVAQGSSVI